MADGGVLRERRGIDVTAFEAWRVIGVLLVAALPLLYSLSPLEIRLRRCRGGVVDGAVDVF